MWAEIWAQFINLLGTFFDPVLSLVFSILPNNADLVSYFDLDLTGMNSSLLSVANSLAQFNTAFPFDVVFLLISMVLTFEAILLLFKVGSLVLVQTIRIVLGVISLF